MPQTARVNRNELKAPEVAYQGDPQFQPIEPTTVQRAVNTDKDILKAGDLYYMCFQGVWFMSASPTGPWEVATTVPKQIYEIPASSPAHHVTYVTVVEEDDNDHSITLVLTPVGALADHRHHQASVRSNGHTDMLVIVIDNVSFVYEGIDFRKLLERLDGGLDKKGHEPQGNTVLFLKHLLVSGPHGHGLMRGGTSVSNMLSGDAFKSMMTAAGFDIGLSETPITPVMLGDEHLAREFSRILLDEQAVFAQAISFPTVARGKARIRVMISAAHTEDDLRQGAAAFVAVGRELGVVT